MFRPFGCSPLSRWGILASSMGVSMAGAEDLSALNELLADERLRSANRICAGNPVGSRSARHRTCPLVRSVPHRPPKAWSITEPLWLIVSRISYQRAPKIHRCTSILRLRSTASLVSRY